MAIQFEKKYSTPLAQKQYELECAIKSLEIARGENISGLLHAITVGFGYVLLMGGLIGYGSFDGGYVVLGWLSILTFGFFLAGSVVRINAEISRPNFSKAQRFLGIK